MEEITEADDVKSFLSSYTVSTRINQRSELAEEIISNKPDFMEKWALLIFLGILLVMLASTWFVRYPDIIEARAILTAQNGPKEIISRQDGRLVRLFFHNNERVSRNEIIGWIESTANHKEIITLSNQIDSGIILLNLNELDKVSKIFNKRYNNLGEIQPVYQQFISAWQIFNDYMVNGFYAKKKNLLMNDISSLNKSKEIIENQKGLTEQDVKIAEESFKMNKKLLDEKVLTKEEYRTQTSRYVNKQLAIPQINNSLLDNQTQQRNKLKEIDQLNHDIAQQKIIFSQTLHSLKSQIDDWVKKYIIKAPIDGKVTFIIPLQENQNVQSGRVLGFVNPIDSHFYAEATLPQYNFGKLDTGLAVQLRFDAYPYQEMGFIEGRLNYISDVPSDSGFLATVKFNHGLMTNNHRLIPYKNGLKAQAIIITKNMRLMERLYYNIVKSTSVGK
ncbi:MAG: hemolysin secretion protein [Mucilaginibacter sp.]|nr:hemolysin secretion protein [Mucilaginibacter sp.]